MSVNNSKVLVHRDSKTGQFYLLRPGLTTRKVEGSIDETWVKLEKEIEEKKEFFKEAGLEDEATGFNVRKAFEKNFWLESLIKGTIFAIPVFIGFLLFAFILIKEMNKLTLKVKDALNPYKEESMKSKEGFKRTLERYRPYVYETLLMLEEEKARVQEKRKE